jgi:ABC-2 type transport system permease protein
MDAGLDAGRYTFAINIPPNFQRDVLAGRQPEVQVNVDATRMSQAFTGNGYIQNIISGGKQLHRPLSGQQRAAGRAGDKNAL